MVGLGMSTPVTSKRILLAVPGQLRRAAIRAALCDSGFAVAAEGNSVQQALDAVGGRAEQDLLLFEHDPSRTDLRSLAQFKEARPTAGVIMLADRISQDQFLELLDAGVDGFVDRRGSLRSLVSYVDLVLHGERAIQPSLIGAPDASPDASPRQAILLSPSAPQLSNREHAVVGLLATGLTDKEIARRLDIVHGTVRNYVRSAQRKLSLGNRTQVAVWAQQQGIVNRDADVMSRSLFHSTTTTQTSEGPSRRLVPTRLI